MKYMYFKNSITRLKHCSVLVLILFASNWAKAQSDFTMTPAIACAGVDLTSVTVTPNIPIADVISYTIRWGIPNDTAVNKIIAGNPPNTFFSKTYANGGDYTVTLVVKRNNGPDIVVTKTRKIWKRPTTSFTLTSNDNQCFKGNQYCFNNTSVQGTAPLKSFEWTYGDGNARFITDTNLRNVCHQYALNNPAYQVGLRVIDSVGCTTDPIVDLLSAKAIKIAPDIKPGFTITGRAQCDSSQFIFKNTTQLSYANTQSFIWDYGDGRRYVSGPPNTNAQDLARWNNAYTHIYTQNNVFRPFLIVQDRRSGCRDTFYYETTGLTLPENIIYQIEILTKRSIPNDSIADSVCLMKEGDATLTLYNKYDLQGVGGTQLDIQWHFRDPNANPPGSDVLPFRNIFQPTYQYKGMGQFFPTLTIICPGTPAKVRTYNFWSKIDTLPDDINRYQYQDYQAAPKAGFPAYTNPNGPVLNPTLYTRNGRILTPNTATNAQFYNYNGKLSAYAYDTIYSTVDPTEILGIHARHIGWADSMSSSWDFFRTGENALIKRWVDTTSTTFRNPFTSVLITRPFYRDYFNPISRSTRVADTLFRDRLIGLGVNILGPFVRIENPFPAGGPPPPRDVVQQWQKLQCGPTFPVQFVNNSLTYQSDRLWIRWDFAEDQYAPACTSYSIPNPSAAGNGLKPYLDAADLQNRTIGAFVANGKAYLGRLNTCNYSHDTFPTRQYTNWDVIFDWFRYGHDFPPYDNTRWSKGYTQWPSPTAPPPNVTWVQPRDSAAWNKPMTAVGPTPTRIDTMVNIWPNDIPANNIITLNRGIPDPISSSRGNWMDLIPAGTRIDTGQLLITLATPANDGQPRVYRGSDIIPGISPTKTLYKYAFERQVIQDITVTLRMKDTMNNISGDPSYRTVKLKFDTIKVYDPVTFGLKDSIIRDSVYLDDWDCNGTSSVTLSFTRPDAFGLSQDGKVCPNFKSGSSGGDPQLLFNRTGYVDSARTNQGAGIIPTNQRTMLLINYDSLLDRNDNTPCNLDGFVTWQGGTTPGGTVMPMMYLAVNYPPQPPRQWSSPSGTRAWLHYWPSGPTGGGVSNMPVDPKGWVTIGLIVGTGCFSPTNCTLPSCFSDTVWYHKFFRFIELNANYTTERFAYEYPSKPAFCYLRGKGDEVTFHYYDSIQDNVIADIWSWGDGTATVDSFYYQPDEDIPYNRIRYNFNSNELPWTLSNIEYFPIGTRVSVDTIINIIYRCDDIARVLPPTRIDTIIERRDSSLMFTPIKHRYYKSTFEQMVLGGNGQLERRGDITPVLHNMVANNFSRCENRITKYLVIGVIDTFDIKNAAGDWDTVFCQGETVYFYDSIRYWYPSSNCSRPLAPGENFDRNHDFGNMHDWSYSKFDYPNDTIKASVNYDLTDYLIYPGTTAVCPLTHNNLRVVGTDANGAPATRCFKNREFFHERIYWDFQTDGVIDAFGSFRTTNPVTWKYPVYGRYKVSMYSIDSTGRWDTCVQFVNVVKPKAFIEAKPVYICGDKFIFKDSSIIYDDYFASTGIDSLDRIVGWKWWFGDRKYNPLAPQSILEDPQYDYRRYGKYTLRLAINTEQGCTDTAFKDFIINGPRPRLIILDDTLGCVPHKVRVVSIPEREPWADIKDTITGSKLTIIRSGRPDNLSIPIKYSVIDTVEFFYDEPGTYYIRAEAFSTEDGSSSACRPVYYPDTVDGFQLPIRITTNIPYQVGLESSKDTVCVGEVFRLFNRSDKDTINRFRMDVFDANYTTRLDSLLKTDYVEDSSWQYKFNQIGQYQLVLNSTRFEKGFSPCKNQDTVTMVALKSKADFIATPAGEGFYRLQNTSDTAISDKYTWKIYNLPENTLFTGYPKDFDEASNLNDFTQEFNIDSTKSFNVCIIADVAGTQSCPDSVCKIIEVIVPKGKINIPNVFTPNDDGINDVFKIDITGEKKYKMLIWNRWGNNVFESDRSDFMWNGRTNNDGGENPAGTYYYLLTYQLRGGEEKTVRGSITLIRK